MMLSHPLRWLAYAALALGLAGCFPMGGRTEDEEKDPHYQVGMSRISSMDYDGAIASFENALASNPKSAAAHRELGLLYDEKKTNYAAAIYHLEKHLELKPESHMAETIRQKIFACKLELAKTVSFALVSRQVQDEMRKLNATNILLRDQLDQLRAELAQQTLSWSNRLVQASRATVSPQPVPATPSELERREPERRSPPPDRSSTPILSNVAPRQPTVPRTYVIRPGDTFASVARKYNLKLPTLQAANPGVDSRRLKAGQVINLPPTRN